MENLKLQIQELKKKLQEQALEELSNTGQLMDQLGEKNKKIKELENSKMSYAEEYIKDWIKEDQRKYNEKILDYEEPSQNEIDCEYDNFLKFLYDFYKKMR